MIKTNTIQPEAKTNKADLNWYAEMQKDAGLAATVENWNDEKYYENGITPGLDDLTISINRESLETDETPINDDCNWFYHIATRDEEHIFEEFCLREESGTMALCDCQECKSLGVVLYRYFSIYMAIKWAEANRPNVCVDFDLIESDVLLDEDDSLILDLGAQFECDFLRTLGDALRWQFLILNIGSSIYADGSQDTREPDYSLINTLTETYGKFVPIGNIVLTSGQIVACDPHSPDHQPFAVGYKPGVYPIMVYSDGGNNRMSCIQFNDNPAVTWSNAVFAGNASNNPGDGELQGYDVDSGTGCFADPDAITSYKDSAEEYDWLLFGNNIKGCEPFFYADFSDERFCELTDGILKIERELRQITGWQETLTAKDVRERSRQRNGLYKDFNSLYEYIEHFKSEQPEKADRITKLQIEKLDLMVELAIWTAKNAFNDQMESGRDLWYNMDQHKAGIFSNFKNITLNDENKTNVITFTTGWGDGTYPSYFGYDENGEICVLITDFDGVGFDTELEDEDDWELENDEESEDEE